ncbi:MAG: class 1 fructose-bisphosphatase [Planctomycetes bacterium]|nr:class 1 fructose-bisphosphatase [Planctomycetota bacterium]
MTPTAPILARTRVQSPSGARSGDAGLPALLSALGAAAGEVARDLRRGAPIGRGGPAGSPGARAERAFLEALGGTGLVGAVLSGEGGFRRVGPGAEAPFLVTLDPLAPSSNRGVNGALGAIFGAFRRVRASAGAHPGEFLRPGRELSAAGYVLFGPSTWLVLGDGSVVRAFALDPERGDFRPVDLPIRCPETGPTYCANLESVASWPSAFRRFLGRLRSGAAEATPPSLRTSGCVVADAHRVLLEGGACVHPTRLDGEGGGLRLLLEAGPLAFLVEGAGGAASTGTGRLLDAIPGSLLDRVPAVFGSRFEVAMFESFGRGEVS